MPGKSLLKSDLEDVRATREITELRQTVRQRQIELRASELAREQVEQNLGLLKLQQNATHKPTGQKSIACRKGSVGAYY